VRVISATGSTGWAEAFYSYGDSAGFTPDFPFNDAGRQPNRRESTAFLGADEKL